MDQWASKASALAPTLAWRVGRAIAEFPTLCRLSCALNDPYAIAFETEWRELIRRKPQA